MMKSWLGWFAAAWRRIRKKLPGTCHEFCVRGIPCHLNGACMPWPMSKTQKANAATQAAVSPKISPEWFDRLVRGSMTAEAVEDASRALKKALTERALELKSALPKIFSTLGLPSKVKPARGNWTCREEAIMGTS